MQKRITTLQSVLQNQEALIITGDANRLYFTGFPSSAGVLFITKNSADFLIDFRYFEKAQSAVHHCNVVLCDHLYQQLRDLIDRHNIKTVFTETSYLTLETFQTFQQMLPDCAFSMDPALNDFVLHQRSIKSPEEVRSIRCAQKITDDTFDYIIKHIVPGKTERDIMLEMEFYLRQQGSEGVSFDFIVVSGKNSSLPHGVPTDKPIENGDFITMDFGAVINGYRSDMTRTVAVGEVTEQQRVVYNTVLSAQKKALAAIAPGKVCKEIDAVARSFINESGFEGCFGHGLGHSVGIEIHESPCFNTVDETPLTEGMILTVEPGIYLPEQFGVRIEDMVWITNDGYENLTASPKELIVL